MKKVLLVSGQEFIEEQKDGGKKCTYRNYKMLQEVYGIDNVYVYIFTNNELESEEKIVRKKSHKSTLHKVWNVFNLRLFYNKKAENELINYIRQENFNIVFFERSMYGRLIKKLAALNIDTEVFMENIERRYVWNKVVKESIFFVLPYIATSISEKQSLHYAKKVICLTERDANYLQTIYKRKCDAIIPMTFKDNVDENVFENHLNDMAANELEKELMFIGANFGPNYDGIKWFIENVMKELQEFSLTIVGKDFEKKKNELESDRVKIIGTVDNLEEYYLRNTALVMPILYGDGIKVKTAEAMMYGKVIFGSREAFNGYEVEDVSGIFFCNTESDYIQTIRNYFCQNGSKAFSKAVRNCFLVKYENKSAVMAYREII